MICFKDDHLSVFECSCALVSPGHAAAAAEESARGMLLQHLRIRLPLPVLLPVSD